MPRNKANSLVISTNAEKSRRCHCRAFAQISRLTLEMTMAATDKDMATVHIKNFTTMEVAYATENLWRSQFMNAQRSIHAYAVCISQ